MAHFTKYTRGAAHATITHDRRDKCGVRKNIDESRTHMNYNLCDCDDEIVKLTRIIDMSKKSGAYMRDDMNVICSCIITLPEDFIHNETLEKEFFKGCYDFLCNDFGKENMISAWCHRDECLKNEERKYKPHMHIKFCPIIEKEKNGKTVYQFDAYKKVSRTYLRTFHKRLEEHLTDYLGFNPHILNGATKCGNKTIEQLKNDTHVKKCVSVYESNKEMIAGFWDEYKELSTSYWAEYKRQKELIKKELLNAKRGMYYDMKNIENGLDFICNLSHGLLYALTMLFIALLAILENKNELEQIKRLESDLERLEGIRRKVSNYQHNTKERLRKEEIEGIEEGLQKWENAVMTMNMFFNEHKRDKEEKRKIDFEYESVDEECR